jgi:hypothetical protein
MKAQGSLPLATNPARAAAADPAPATTDAPIHGPVATPHSRQPPKSETSPPSKTRRASLPKSVMCRLLSPSARTRKQCSVPPELPAGRAEPPIQVAATMLSAGISTSEDYSRSTGSLDAPTSARNVFVNTERNTMNRSTTLTRTSMALLCLAVALSAGNAVAQQRQHVSFKAPAENSKFTRQLNIEVGDVPNHIVRIFEVLTTYPQ